MLKRTTNGVVPYLDQELVDELKAQLAEVWRPWSAIGRAGRAAAAGLKQRRCDGECTTCASEPPGPRLCWR